MKRYNPTLFIDEETLLTMLKDKQEDYIEMIEETKGEWVKWEDAKFLEYCLEQANYTKEELKLQQIKWQHKKQYTCYECISARWCRMAWDEYNTNGDCLSKK